MKKGRFLAALCAALMCVFMFGACSGCDGGGGGGKTEVDLLKDVIAVDCNYSKFIFQELVAEKVSSQTSKFVGKSSAEVYGNISFFTKTEDEFDISHISFSIYPPASKMIIGISILNKESSSTPHFRDSKTIDFSSLTLEQRQQGREIKWDFNKLNVKGVKFNSENAVITIGFSFLYENGNYIEMYKLSDESEFNSFKFNIGNLEMK